MTKNLLILKITGTGFRARDLDTDEIFSVKSTSYKGVDELNTVTLQVAKEWEFNKTRYLSGEVSDYHFSLTNLGISPHEYESMGPWDPREMFGDEAGQYVPEYLAEPFREEIIFKDYSGYGFYGPDTDPVYSAVEAQSRDERYDILTRLFEDFPQCIDSLVHIGHMYLDSTVSKQRAENCYRAAVHIAEGNLPDGFDGVVEWSPLENRPYLRALHGLCLILWDQSRFDEASTAARKLRRLCPLDNLGVRFLIDPIEQHQSRNVD